MNSPVNPLLVVNNKLQASLAAKGQRSMERSSRAGGGMSAIGRGLAAMEADAGKGSSSPQLHGSSQHSRPLRAAAIVHVVAATPDM